MKITDNIYSLPVGSLEVNCVVIKCPDTSNTIIFDPGDDFDKIIKMIESINCNPVYIISTHCHYDHIGAVEELRKKYNIPFLIHTSEREYSESPEKNYSVMSDKEITISPDKCFKDGEIIKSGSLEIRVIHTPGHTLGSCCFLIKNILISGDTLFAGSVGRTDLYGGSTDSIIRSIKERILILDEDTIVIPGHGRNTTIKQEKRFNPFL